MSRVAMNVGVSSQVPTLISQFNTLKVATSGLADSLNSKSLQASATSRSAAAVAQQNAAKSVANMAKVSTAFNSGVQNALSQSRQFRQLANQTTQTQLAQSRILTGSDRIGAGQVRDETAILSGAGQSRFAQINEEIKKAASSAEEMDRLTELAVERSRALLLFARESMGLQQEQTGLLKSQRAENFAIAESARMINTERRAEFEIVKQIGTLAGADPRFGKAQKRMNDLQAEQSLQFQRLGIEQGVYKELSAQGITRTELIAQLNKQNELGLVGNMQAVNMVAELDTQMLVQSNIQQLLISENTLRGEVAAKAGLLLTELAEIESMELGVDLVERDRVKTNAEIVDSALKQLDVLERIGSAENRAAAGARQRSVAQRDSQVQSFARQPFFGGLGRMPDAPGSKQLELQVLGVMEQGVKVQTAQGMATAKLSEEQARLLVARSAGTAALKKYNMEYQISNGLLRRNRAQMINNSIGMFVLSITITQTVAALEEMIGSWAEADEEAKIFGFGVKNIAGTLKELNQIIRFSIGPIQVYTSIMQLASQANLAFFMSALPVLATFGGLGLALKGLTSQNDKARKGFSALAVAVSGAGFALAVYNAHVTASRAVQAAAAASTLSLTSAQNGETFAVLGTVGAKSAEIVVSKGLINAKLGELAVDQASIGTTWALFTAKGAMAALKNPLIGIPLVLSALALAASAYATAKSFTSFETGPGEYKSVGKTGMAMVHEGEKVYTPQASIGEQGSFDAGGGIKIYVAGNLDTSVPRIMSRRTKAGQIGGIRY